MMFKENRVKRSLQIIEINTTMGTPGEEVFKIGSLTYCGSVLTKCKDGEGMPGALNWVDGSLLINLRKWLNLDSNPTANGLRSIGVYAH